MPTAPTTGSIPGERWKSAAGRTRGASSTTRGRVPAAWPRSIRCWAGMVMEVPPASNDGDVRGRQPGPEVRERPGPGPDRGGGERGDDRSRDAGIGRGDVGRGVGAVQEWRASVGPADPADPADPKSGHSGKNFKQTFSKCTGVTLLLRRSLGPQPFATQRTQRTHFRVVRGKLSSRRSVVHRDN